MKFYEFTKRIFDFFLAVILLLISLPLLFLTSLILIFELKEIPLLFQERGLTLEKRRFKILKFKTIPKIGAINGSRSNNDIFLKPALSKYVPPFASWLRRTGLDELPQLLNIILGQMSFIGPRPLMLSDLMLMKKKYPNHYAERNKFSSKPGISGMWQIFGNRAEGINNLIVLEYLYEKNRSLLLDLKLAFRTIAVILKAKNSDAILANFKTATHRNYEVSNSSFSFPFGGKSRNAIFKKKKLTISENLTIDLPLDWWYSNDSYKDFLEQSKAPNIIDLEKYRKEKFGKSA